MPVGINFGSATSGAGFDVATTVSSIMAIQRTPETSWKAKVTSLQAQDVALTTLGGNLSALSTALSSLTTFDGTFASKQGASSDPSVVTLTGADYSAQAGTHTLTVQKLAQTSSKYSSTVGPVDTLGGTLTLQVGSAAARTFTLDSSKNTLSSLAGAINQAGMGVSATIITDRSGSRLSLVSSSSGIDGEITVSSAVTVDGSGSPVSFITAQPGVDAMYTIDGVSLTNSSNSITAAIPGVSFQLLHVSDDSVQMQIANNTTSISTALGNFVTAYNSLVTGMTAQEGKDSSGNAQPLFGDRTLAQIQEQMSAAITFVPAANSSIKSIAALGVTVGLDGKLTLNQQTLSAALTRNFSEAANFFQDTGSFGQHMVATLNSVGSDSSTGAVALALKQNASQEATLNANTTNLEARLVTYEAGLTSQLNIANQILQGIPSQLNEMKQIYAAITGYNGT